MPFNLREALLMLLAVSLSILLVTIQNAALIDAIHPWMGSGAVVVLILSCAGLFFLDMAKPVGPVDVWRLQREVMRLSDQSLPDRPMITRDSMLYMALILEEFGETCVNMSIPILREVRRLGSGAPNRTELYKVYNEMNMLADVAKSWTGTLKSVVANVDPAAYIPLNRAEAHALLDDATDMSVVAAGFPLATGLPAAGAYLEVTSSNISKKNPETGRIEKDVTGKWVKGPNYRAPDLHDVLDQA